MTDWSEEPEGGYIVSPAGHWRVTWDEDGEPIGEVCRCNIGEDHKKSGALL